MAYLIGAGTKLYVEISASMELIPQVREVTPPALEMGTAETTHLLSSAREHVATIPDPGEVSFTLEWDPDDATHEQLWDYFTGKTMCSWKIQFINSPSPTTIEFDGLIKNFGIDNLDVDAVATIPVTIQVSGMPVITAAGTAEP
jgi:hypothetical protein